MASTSPVGAGDVPRTAGSSVFFSRASGPACSRGRTGSPANCTRRPGEQRQHEGDGEQGDAEPAARVGPRDQAAGGLARAAAAAWRSRARARGFSRAERFAVPCRRPFPWKGVPGPTPWILPPRGSAAPRIAAPWDRAAPCRCAARSRRAAEVTESRLPQAGRLRGRGRRGGDVGAGSPPSRVISGDSIACLGPDGLPTRPSRSWCR